MVSRSSLTRSRFVTFLCVGLFAALWSADSAWAQNPFSDFLGGIFGGHSGGSSRGPRPPPDYSGSRVRRIMPHRENRAPSYWHGESHETKRPAVRRVRHEDVSPDKKAADGAPEPAAPASFFVAVGGDTLGMMLADGLDEAFEDKTDIAIVNKGKDSSGLVREDFYDWSKGAREIAADPRKFNVAIMMVGANDRQALRDGADLREPFSPRWREVYVARVDAVIAAFKDKGVPLVWVGLPVMKSEHFSADMAKLNEIYRERAAHAGIAYVDLWEAFSDERGQYSAFGPDVNGETVKLRAADGVHFTNAGARKLAHFVEGEVKKLFDAHKPAAPQADAPDAGAAQPSAVLSPSEPAKPAAQVVFRSPAGVPPAPAPSLPDDRPAVGPVQALTPAAAEGEELAKRSAASPNVDAASSAARALAKHVFVDGGDQPARANRADDFAWPVAAPRP